MDLLRRLLLRAGADEIMSGTVSVVRKSARSNTPGEAD
jgi:hypothetical protein